MSYTFDANGNLLATGSMTNTWDAANRLTAVSGQPSAVSFSYNGVGNRVGRVSNGVTTTFALDVQGLPEVIYTSDGNAYLHLPGVIVAENTADERRYLLSDGLGSIRQAVDESGAVVAYNEYDPYGNPVENDSVPYGFTGEWWEDEVGLLYLRARWYAPETGVFLSVDSVESEPPYQYVGGNVVNLTDLSGYFPPIPPKNFSRPFIGNYNNSNIAQKQWASGPCSDWNLSGLWGRIFSKKLCLRAYNGDEDAMEEIYRRIANVEWPLFPEASRALNHFLDAKGTNLFFDFNWLFQSSLNYNSNTGKATNDYMYYLELVDQIKDYAITNKNTDSFWESYNSTPLTRRDGSNFGINTPFGDQQLVLGARTMCVDFYKKSCNGFIVADFYVYEYFDFRKDVDGGGAGDTLGIFTIPLGNYPRPTVPTQWADQLVISGRAKEYWTIVAWRQKFKMIGSCFFPLPAKNYSGPFPSTDHPFLYPACKKPKAGHL